MKKLLTTTILVAMIASLGAAFAQASQQHEVQVVIPDVLMIRITTGASNAAVDHPDAVVFDLNTVTFEPADTYSPTNLTAANWDNVRVFANHSGWQVTVAVAITHTAFDWRKVRVEPSGDDSIANFSLPAAGGSADIASDTTRTNGWLPLGFGPDQFLLTLDGTEEAGTFTTTVTYTITAH